MARFITSLLAWLTIALPALSQSILTTGGYGRVIIYTPRTETGEASSIQPNGATSVQYLDASGRSLQSVAVGASPTQKDIVQTNTFDYLSRPERSYLPFPANNASGGFRGGVEPATVQGFYDSDPKPYGLTSYQANGTPERQLGPGNAWHEAARGASQTVETAGDGIRFWQVSDDGNTISDGGSYPGHSLVKATTTNEQNQTSITHTDKEGRTIRQEVGGLLTQYVYDDFERLRAVIPPKASGLGTFNVTDGTVGELVFVYKYDDRGHLTEKLTPGGGWTHFVYNQQGQVVMSQDARQRGLSQWSFVKYDGLGRTTLTGVLGEGKDRSQLQSDADGYYEQYERRGGSLLYYTNESFPSVSEGDILTANYYDDYDWGLPGQAGGSGFNAKGLATGNRVRRSDNSDWLVSTVYYNDRNRVVLRKTQNHLGDWNDTAIEYNFAGDVTKETVTYRWGGRTLAVQSRYDYDHAGRQTRVWHKTGSEEEIQLARYEYDELGRLTKKQLQPDRSYTSGGGGGVDYITRDGNNPPPNGTTDEARVEVKLQGELTINGEYTARIGNNGGSGGGTTTALQTIDYRYNVRGQLRSLNGDSSNNPSLNGAENDLFALKLDYQEAAVGGTTYYNGLLAQQTWRSKRNTAQNRSFSYNYDGVNRLTGASYGGLGGENYNVWDIQYDANGNLTRMQRNGLTATNTGERSGTPTSFGQIDNLTYQYHNGGNSNRLSGVSEGAGNAGLSLDKRPIDFRNRNGNEDDYGYNADGSLNRDSNKELNSIVYNRQGQIGQLLFSGGRSIEYAYDGTGAKLYKKISAGGNVRYLHYVGDLELTGTTGNTLRSISHDEGRVLPTNGGSYIYEYQYRDHLGNLRVSLRQATSEGVVNATFEPGEATREQAQFTGVAEARNGVEAYEGNFSARVLDGVGPGKELSIVAGDRVRMQVMGHVVQPQRTQQKRRWWPIPFLTTEKEYDEFGQVTGSRLRLVGGIALPFGKKTVKEKTELPVAYLQYVLTDTAGVVVQTQRVALTDSAKAGWEPLMLSLEALRAGTLRVQVVNEGGQGPVYFDNLVITQQPPVIVQETHYDPWGMELVGITTEGMPDDDNKFQGKEHEDEFALEWDDFGARMYDPQLGRWQGMDPADQFASPYLAMGNTPTVSVDPDGRIVPLVFLAAALIGGGGNLLLQYSKGRVTDFGSGLKAFGIGAVAGVAGAATGGAAVAAWGTAAGAGGFIAGAVGGAVGSATSNIALGIGNYVGYGDAYDPSTLGRDVLIGAAAGGAINGAIAGFKGKNVWNGWPKAPGYSRLSIPGSGYRSALEVAGYQRVANRWWNPFGNLTYVDWQLPSGNTVQSFGGANAGSVAASNSAPAQQFSDGTFSILDWTGYPQGTVPRPAGPFRILEGTEYETARRLANTTNEALKRQGVFPRGQDVHEIHPVKFGGSPTDVANKVSLPRSTHSQYTTWWTRLQRNVRR